MAPGLDSKPLRYSNAGGRRAESQPSAWSEKGKRFRREGRVEVVTTVAVSAAAAREITNMYMPAFTLSERL